MPGRRGVVVLDVEVTPELAAEGLARDVVRRVQDERRSAGLAVTDRIELHLALPPEEGAAVEAHRAYVMEQVLATSMQVTVGEPASVTVSAVPT